MDNDEKAFRQIIKAMAGFWVVALILSLGFLGVVGWAIIAVVQHIIG